VKRGERKGRETHGKHETGSEAVGAVAEQRVYHVICDGKVLAKEDRDGN
jgi:hypothetical protein